MRRVPGVWVLYLPKYFIICYPYLGIGIFKIIIIPCSCIDCRNTMDLTWDPYLVPKYHPNSVKIKYYPILGKYNDWTIMGFIGKVTDEEKYEYFHKIVLNVFVIFTDQTIQVGSIGAIDADDKHPHGYYIVEVLS